VFSLRYELNSFNSIWMNYTLPSPLPNALPFLQATFTRRTGGHCVGTCAAENFSLFLPPLNVVSFTTLPPLALLCHAGFKGLN
jgi:hypothetical protein